MHLYTKVKHINCLFIIPENDFSINSLMQLSINYLGDVSSTKVQRAFGLLMSWYFCVLNQVFCHIPV